MIPPKPLSSKVWVSGRGLARDWQARKSGRCQPVLKKQRARCDIECGDFGLAVSTVGWELRVAPSSVERINLFARDHFTFVVRFVLEIVPRFRRRSEFCDRSRRSPPSSRYGFGGIRPMADVVESKDACQKFLLLS
jgi:hypothetical protein